MSQCLRAIIQYEFTIAKEQKLLVQSWRAFRRSAYEMGFLGERKDSHSQQWSFRSLLSQNRM